MVLAVWVASVLTIGIVATIESPTMGLPVAMLAVIPATIANWLWNPRELTLAELAAKYRD